jgi:hypothetical protein
LAVQELRRTRQDALLRSWLAALPDELIRRHPVLSRGTSGPCSLPAIWTAPRRD